MSRTRRRCAIYTRKSHEEGLDQDFNSLDAQREACEAYIRSQRHEGWVVGRQRYDDGGFSGGTMERPALQALLRDVRASRIDTIVVYKVDRLSRSLSDFAKIVDALDEHEVSFVSVTQQFNTTTSMGRLTLNILLSFAQFEREVTAERIRDKIAASKKKGMWMGGVVPLGYDTKDKRLLPNQEEAGTVRKLFTLYLETGSVRLLKAEADRLGLRTKARAKKDGGIETGRPFARGHLYRLLANPIYIGEVVHKDSRFPGEHEAIVDRETWDAVQLKLRSNRVGERKANDAGRSSLLSGLLYDGQGRRLVPSHANSHGKRYRYYISQEDNRDGRATGQLTRLPAEAFEQAIVNRLTELLRDRLVLGRHLESAGASATIVSRVAHGDLAAVADQLETATPGSKRELLRAIVDRIDVAADTVKVLIHAVGLVAQAGDPSGSTGGKGSDANDIQSFTLEFPYQIQRSGVARKVLVAEQGRPDPEVDPKLVALVRQARDWYEQLRDGSAPTLKELAAKVGRDRADVGRRLQMAFLAPDIVEAILDGHQPAQLSVTSLTRLENLPLSWAEQRRVLGFDS